jgi:hypothetical protein
MNMERVILKQEKREKKIARTQFFTIKSIVFNKHLKKIKNVCVSVQGKSKSIHTGQKRKSSWLRNFASSKILSHEAIDSTSREEEREGEGEGGREGG